MRIAEPLGKRVVRAFERVAAATVVAAATIAVSVGVPAGAQTAPDALNMTLVGANNLGGQTGGEGMAMKIAEKTTARSVAGHRYFYVASEANGDSVACFSVLDVQNPAAPTLRARIPISVGGANVDQVPNGTPAQRAQLRCNSLDIAGNVLAVAQQVATAGAPGAGILFYDVSDPARPKLLSYFNTAGGFSVGTHLVWFANGGKTLWAAGGAGNTHIPSDAGNPYAGQAFVPKRVSLDFQFPQVVDVNDPTHPKEQTRWYYPGVSAGDPRPAPDALPGADAGVRLHNVDVFPERANRAYLSMLDGGIVIADISDPFHIRPISIMRYRGPGFTHTTYPLFARNLLEVSEEATGTLCADGPKRATVWSIRDERLPVLLDSAPFLDTYKFCPPHNTLGNTGRYGSHNIWEGKPNGPAWHSDQLMLDTFFRGGLRVFDISNPSSIQDVAHYIPAFSSATNPVGSIQINDVYVDDRGYVYICDRFGDGLYVLTSPLIRCGQRGQCHTAPDSGNDMTN